MRSSLLLFFLLIVIILNSQQVSAKKIQKKYDHISGMKFLKFILCGSVDTPFCSKQALRTNKKVTDISQCESIVKKAREFCDIQFEIQTDRVHHQLCTKLIDSFYTKCQQSCQQS